MIEKSPYLLLTLPTALLLPNAIPYLADFDPLGAQIWNWQWHYSALCNLVPPSLQVAVRACVDDVCMSIACTIYIQYMFNGFDICIELTMRV